MTIQQQGDTFVIYLSQEEILQRGLQSGDQVEIIKLDFASTAEVRQVAEQVLQDHAATIEFLADK